MLFKEYSHQYWMAQAIDLAKKTDKEVPISALIVKENKLISASSNKMEELNDATAHAEILVIRDASNKLGDWRLNDCVLYTTLEPCSMCAGAIINSRISKLVFGAYDLNAGACGSAINLFHSLDKINQIEMLGGILELEASELLKSFFRTTR